jgi:hypothetical protein
MVTVFGLFTTYRDAEAAVDRLVVEGIDEKEINVIANAPLALERIGPQLESADLGKSGGEVDGISETLDTLLVSSPEVGVPETGMVIAGGKQARDLVEHNTGIDRADESLPLRMMGMGLAKEEVRRYLGGIRDRGVMLWVRVNDEQAEDVSRLYTSGGARHVVVRRE